MLPWCAVPLGVFSPLISSMKSSRACDGLEALATFDTFKPDVVTLDITMPHLDGLSVLEEMIKRNSDVRVLIISAPRRRPTLR